MIDRLNLSAHRKSVLEGEGVYLAVEGLTRAETGTFGFKWDMDDVAQGGYRLMSGMPQKYRARNNPQGHITAYAWRTPGTRTVRCRVIPPAWSGIEGVTLTIEVTVGALATRFRPTNTWVVDPGGTFLDAPSGRHVRDIGEAHKAALRNGGGLICLAKDQTHALTRNAGFDTSRQPESHLYYTSFGPGQARPVIDVSQSAFNSGREEAAFAVTFRDIVFRGDYDPVTGRGNRRQALRFRPQSHMTICDCAFSGVESGITVIKKLRDVPGSVMVFDTSLTDWENFGLYIAESDIVALVGCTGIQNPATVVGYEAKEIGQKSNQPDHAFCRISQAHIVVFYNNQGFTANGWSHGSSNDPNVDKFKKHQPLLRMGSSGLAEEGCSVFIGNNYLEGTGIDLTAGASHGISGLGLIVVTGNYNIDTANGGGTGFGHSGVWYANNIVVTPNVPSEVAKMRSFQYFNIRDVSFAFYDGMFRLSHNTLAYMLDAGNDPKDPDADTLTGRKKFREIRREYGIFFVVEGTLLWAPNRTIAGESGPYEPFGEIDAPVFGPAPFYEGLRIEQEDGSVYFDPGYATPADAAILPVPARNVTVPPSEHTHALDFHGSVRPASPTVGAVELAPLPDPDF